MAVPILNSFWEEEILYFYCDDEKELQKSVIL